MAGSKRKPRPPVGMDMRLYARQQADLVVTYAEDGAYHSAAAVARALTATLQAHADRVSPPVSRTEAG